MRRHAFALTVILAVGPNCSKPELIDNGGSDETNARSTPQPSTTSEDGNADGDDGSDSGNEDKEGSPGISEIVKPDDGGANSTTTPSGSNDGAGVSFSLVEPILKKSCTNCHNPTGANPDLTTYAQARIVGQHIVRTAATAMPSMPRGAAQLSESDKATLRAWKDGGFAP